MSLFFPFDMFDIFRDTRRSFSFDFCFLNFLIWVGDFLVGDSLEKIVLLQEVGSLSEVHKLFPESGAQIVL